MNYLQKKLAILIVLCLTSITFGMVSAQDQTIDLPELFTSQNSIAFRYPTGWTVTENTSFVSVSDGTITIEFYTETLTDSILQLSDDTEDGIRQFFSALGVTYTGDTTIELNDETVIGGFQITEGQGQYALLGIGALMPPPGWAFIHVKGNAIDLLGSTDTFLAIINTFGRLQTVDGSSTNTTTTNGAVRNPQAQPIAIVVEPPEPCIISTTTNTAEIRVGPGTNRSVLRSLAPNNPVTVTGTTTVDGAIWWQLDKTQAAPGQQANETWVLASQVTSVGDCDAIGNAAAPPIIRAPRTGTTNSGTSNPGVDPSTRPVPDTNSDEVFIDFYARFETIGIGECTDLNWYVENASEIYYQGFLVFSSNSSSTECPTETTTYYLDVYDDDQNLFTRSVTVVVDQNIVFCSFENIPFFETGSVTAGNEAYHYIDLDACAGERRIWIEMFATNTAVDGLDPFIDVFIDNIYVGSDDDGGGFPHAYIEITIPAGATFISMTVKGYNFNSGGAYEILADYLP